MNLIQRDKDILTGKPDLELIHSIKNFPAKMGVTNQPKEDDFHADMNFYISNGSGMIQINPLIPLDFLYQDGHGAGTTGKLWVDHHESFSNFIKDFKPKNILEVGGGHNLLSSLYLKDDDHLQEWLILEPGKKELDNAIDNRVRLKQDFFDKSFLSKNKKYDCIVNSHLFEHLYDPLNFLDIARKTLKDNGLIVMSVPNTEYMLKNKHANTIMFEHSYYASETFIKYMMEKKGFKLINKEYFRDHSIFFSFKKLDEESSNINLPDCVNENKKLIFSYFNHLKGLVEKINEIIVKDDTQIFMFGAHIFSQILFFSGINEDAFKCILDNDQNKHNKRLYGTSLEVKSPIILKDIKKGIVVLNAGNYNQEIKTQISKINENISFIIN